MYCAPPMWTMIWSPYLRDFNAANGPSNPLALVMCAVRTELPVQVGKAVPLSQPVSLPSQVTSQVLSAFWGTPTILDFTFREGISSHRSPRLAYSKVAG